MSEQYLSEIEVCKKLGIGRTTLVSKFMKMPNFPAHRVPGVRRVLIPEKALEEWLMAQRQGAAK